MKVVLFSPDIPQNVGNVARTCAVTGAELVLIRPLRFSMTAGVNGKATPAARQMKRAGLDYWEDVKMQVLDSIESLEAFPLYFFSTKGQKLYTDVTYEENACLIFGSESEGLPQWIHEKWSNRFYTIPMLPKARSLNLSNAAAIVLYEAIRQKPIVIST